MLFQLSKQKAVEVDIRYCALGHALQKFHLLHAVFAFAKTSV